MQKVQYKPGMTTIFPAIEPLRADMAGDGMDLPQYNINIGGAQSFGISVKRYGLRLKIAKRFVDESGIAAARVGCGGGQRARSPQGGTLFDLSTPSAPSSSRTTRRAHADGAVPAGQGRPDRLQLQGPAQRLHDRVIPSFRAKCHLQNPLPLIRADGR
jgi:hypothetical protein